MGDAALRAEVLAALTRKEFGLTVTELSDGSIEVAGADGNIRRFPFGPTVSKTMCRKLWRWYGIPLAAFKPPPEL